VNLVIGSGPAGVACAHALLERGEEVTLIDGGERLEPELQSLLDGFAGQPRKNWNPEHLQRFRDPVQPTAAGLPMKRTYGSDYPYRSRDHLPVEMDRADLLSSLAQGGLSNVWGANILPFLNRDIEAWPITVSDLVPHYRKVLSFIPYSAARDGMEELFPLYAEEAHPLQPSRQGAALLSLAAENREALARLGLHVGQSRLAVRAPATSSSPGCVYCGECLYGCPHELIYSSRHTLPSLMKQSGFTYLARRVVRRVEEQDGGVRLHVDRLDRPAGEVFEGDRVFVGCGTVESTRLILASQRLYGETAVIHDSQYFLTPFLSRTRAGRIEQEDLHTLSQCMIEVLGEEVAPYSAHLLVYGYSDLFRRALESMAGPALPIVKRPLSRLLSRLMVIQGYLHSDVSPQLHAHLTRKEGEADVLHLKGIPNPESDIVIRRILKRITKAKQLLGGRPLSFKTEITEPGKSYHAGASFPMSASPKGMQSDPLGRPAGMKRTHLIDASCFTNVPATNVTLSVMANAHRIGTHYDGECK
jgi:choline dehydrogenase-like flavoprotein